MSQLYKHQCEQIKTLFWDMHWFYHLVILRWLLGNVTLHNCCFAKNQIWSPSCRWCSTTHLEVDAQELCHKVGMLGSCPSRMDVDVRSQHHIWTHQKISGFVEKRPEHNIHQETPETGISTNKSSDFFLTSSCPVLSSALDLLDLHSNAMLTSHLKESDNKSIDGCRGRLFSVLSSIAAIHEPSGHCPTIAET